MSHLKVANAAAHLAVHEQPSFVWSFENTKAVSFEVSNHSSDELADPLEVAGWQYTAEVFRDGELKRRIALAPLDGPVPVGGSRVFEAHLGVTLIGGDYDLRFGLERKPGASGEEIPFASTASSFRVKNQIMEAFVELINACNFKCTFCPQSTLQRKQECMDFELATKVVGDLANMGHHHPIRVHLLGEPLLYPRFFDFVDATHDLGQSIYLITNGSRFDPETIDAIFRSRVDHLHISLNTPEEELYNQQRGTKVPYDRYMDGIRAMVAAVAERGSPPYTKINILYDMARCNEPEELDRVNRLANEWVNVVRGVNNEIALEPGEVQHFEPALGTTLPIAEGMEILFSPYHSWGEGQSPVDHFCSYPWRQLAVLVDGQATACCVDSEGEICLGDAKVQTVEEIWEGPVLQRMRDAFWNDLTAIEPRCQRCPIRHWDLAAQYRN